MIWKAKLMKRQVLVRSEPATAQPVSTAVMAGKEHIMPIPEVIKLYKQGNK